MSCDQGNLNITWRQATSERVLLVADIYSQLWHSLANELAAEEQVEAPGLGSSPLHLTSMKEASLEKKGKLRAAFTPFGVLQELEATVSLCLERILWLKTDTAAKGRKTQFNSKLYTLERQKKDFKMQATEQGGRTWWQFA